MRRALRRAATRRAQVAVTEFHAPTAGWITNQNLAKNTRNAARVMENWFPEQATVRLRKGWGLHANPGQTVDALFSFDNGTTAKMFAASAPGIWDVSTPNVTIRQTLGRDVFGSVNTQQFRTPGGHYLYVLDGLGLPLLFDGGSWLAVSSSGTPTTLTGVDPSLLIYPFTHKERMFFIEKESLRVWFLATQAIGGELSDLDLSSVFRRGGSLLMGGTFSSDSGSGLDDRCVFVTDQGEFALYAGSNPADANDWALVGVYEIGEPLGPQAWMRAGGDWIIATKEGMVPVSAAIRSDPAALSMSAVSRGIETEWVREVVNRPNEWRCAKWDDADLAMVSMPVDDVSSFNPAQVFVVNVETGAWAKWTGLNLGPMTVFNGGLYAAAGSDIFRAETSAADGEVPYTARLSWWPDDLGSGPRHKRVTNARATFTAATTFEPKISVATNYSATFPTPPSAINSAGGLWDSGLWDNAIWSGASLEYVRTRWNSISRTGFAVAPQVQVTIGGGIAPRVELAAMDVMHEAGGVVV